jgi:hypothetical protein
VHYELIQSTTMSTPKQSARQSDKVRKGILGKLASGGIRQTELVRAFPEASTEVVRAVILGMQERGEVCVEEVNGWNVVSLPPVVKSHKKEMKVEPIMPKVEPLLPKIEPLDRSPGVFVPESPERLILDMLAEGARMRENLVRLVAGQMDEDDANKLLNKMIKSGIINETRSGRISIVQKYAHTYDY